MTRVRKAYLAGDMLKKGSQLLRAQEREALEQIPGVELYNPADQKDINDKSKNPTAEAIFYKDTKAILESDTIIFDADNDSVGTTTEVGQVWGINFMLEMINDALKSSETAEDFRDNMLKILEDIPYKEVHWHNSDIRNVPNAKEEGLRRSFSINQYLYGCLLDLSGEAKTFEEILDHLKK